MLKKRSLLSILLSFVLMCSMMPVSAFGSVESQNESMISNTASSVTMQQNESETTLEDDDAVLEGDAFSSNAPEAEMTTTQGSLDEIVFVFIEWDKILNGDEQNIAVGFNGDIVADDAVLTVLDRESGAELEFECSEALAGAVKFTFNTNVLGAGDYRVASLRYSNDAGDVSFDFTDDASDDYGFVIVDDLDSDQVAKEDTSVYTVDPSGDLVEQDSIEGALAESGAGTMKARARSGRAGNLVVVLDPGHGGSEPGTSAYGMIEKNLNLKIAQYCRDALLEYDGVQVYMTRNSDVYVGLEERAEIAKRYNANVFVSIHNNASESSSPRGSEVIVPLNGSGTELGDKILEQLVALGLEERRVFSKPYDSDPTINYYSVIRNTAKYGIPGIIVEHAFVTNPSDAAFLGNENNLKRLGIADATGIAQRYGLSKMTWEKAAAYVTGLYQKVLGRNPDQGGLNASATALMNGESAAQIAASFFASSEFQNRRLSNDVKVNVAYQALLERNPDQSGKNNALDKLYVGMSEMAVVADLCNSAEFRSLCSSKGFIAGSYTSPQNRDKNYNATAFVQRLYQKVLERNGDVDGLNTHTGSLIRGGSAAELAWSFFGSSEFTRKNISNEQRVVLAYQAMLDRNLDSVGKRDWVGKLDAGMSMRAIVSGLCNSPEWRSLCSKWGIASGSLAVTENRDRNQNATAFVQRLYQKVLERNGDAGGLNTHAGSLLSGWSAADVAWAFFGSPEFSKRQLSNADKVEIAYLVFLDRASDSAGKADWAKRMDNGMPLRYLVAGFVDSNEFKSLCTAYGINSGYIPYDPILMESYKDYFIMGTSPNSVISKMVSYFNSTGYSYPAQSGNVDIAKKYRESDAPTIQAFCTLVYNEATAEGVKPEVVFCQAMKETGWLQFGGSVDAKQFNFAGLGAVDGSTGGAVFSTVAIGIRAQVQHLKCYASTAPLKNTCVDPRWSAAIDKWGRGSAPTLESLNGKWAVPGDGYGQSIRSMIEKLQTR